MTLEYLWSFPQVSISKIFSEKVDTSPIKLGMHLQASQGCCEMVLGSGSVAKSMSCMLIELLSHATATATKTFAINLVLQKRLDRSPTSSCKGVVQKKLPEKRPLPVRYASRRMNFVEAASLFS